MPSEINWENANSYTGSACIQNGDCADGAGEISAEIDNSSVGDRFLALDFQITSDGATLDGGPLEIFVIYEVAVDGTTTYEAGSDTVKPFYRSKVGDVEITDTGSAQYQKLRRIPIDPAPFKIVVWNETGDDISANNLDVDAYTYNEEVQ